MVEMTETAAILHNETPQSLVLLDEIDAELLLSMVFPLPGQLSEYLHNSPEHSAKTLFATHYHELTELAEKLPVAKNYQVLATEKNGEVAFLHKLQLGKVQNLTASQSPGLPDTRKLNRTGDKKFYQNWNTIWISGFRRGQSKVPMLWPQSSGALVKEKPFRKISYCESNDSVIDDLRQCEIGMMSTDELKNFYIHLQKRII